MKPWLDTKPHRIDDSLKNHIICSGFIDPHLHPSMAGVLLPMEFVRALRWKLPWGIEEPKTTESAFDQLIRELHNEKGPKEPLFIRWYQ